MGLVCTICILTFFVQCVFGTQLCGAGVLVFQHQGDHHRVVHHLGWSGHVRHATLEGNAFGPDVYAFYQRRLAAQRNRRDLDDDDHGQLLLPGTELVGIASGESEKPEKTIPKAIRNTVWRTLVFFVLAMTVLAALIPWQKAGVMESPFVYVLDQMGIPYAADIMNFVILTALLSVANSGLYASSRMLWSMSKDGMAPSFFSKLTRRGIPIRALLASLAVALLSLLTSVYAADTVYLWLISAAGMGAVVVWISIAASQFFFRKRFLAEGGKLEDLKYRTPFYPVVPILAFTLNTIVLFSMGLIPDQRIALICGIPLIVIIYLTYVLKQKFGSPVVKTSQEASARTGTE